MWAEPSVDFSCLQQPPPKSYRIAPSQRHMTSEKECRGGGGADGANRRENPHGQSEARICFLGRWSAHGRASRRWCVGGRGIRKGKGGPVANPWSGMRLNGGRGHNRGALGRGGHPQPPPLQGPSLCQAALSLTATASPNGMCNRQYPPPTALVTASNRLPNRFWNLLRGPCPSNTSLAPPRHGATAHTPAASVHLRQPSTRFAPKGGGGRGGWTRSPCTAPSHYLSTPVGGGGDLPYNWSKCASWSSVVRTVFFLGGGCMRRGGGPEEGGGGLKGGALAGTPPPPRIPLWSPPKAGRKLGAQILLAPKAPKQNLGCQPQTLEVEEGGPGGGYPPLLLRRTAVLIHPSGGADRESGGGTRGGGAGEWGGWEVAKVSEEGD